VYWASDSAVGRVSRDGANPTQVARQTPVRRGMAVASDGLVYWTGGGEGAGRIMRTDLAAPAPMFFSGGAPNSPSNLVFNSGFLYWSETNGVVRRITLAGSFVQMLRPAPGGSYIVNSMVVDGTHVYVLES